ncbi:MAG TPA: cytochrome P450 [Acidimicrobiales bacterium]|nr:cytochrome P450 [Acidimicrobiales bacterium]
MTTFEVFDPAVLVDPYPEYARLRAADGLAYVPLLDAYAVSRYADVTGVLREPLLFSSARGMGDMMSMVGDAPITEDGREVSGPGALGRSLIASDPPLHTTMRRLVNRGFTPRVIGDYEPRVREIAEHFVGEMIEKGADGGADLVRDLTYPLPVTVIAEMLGIPAERREQFKAWSDAAVAAFSLTPDPVRFRIAAEEMFDFFVEVIEDRQAHPKDDLVSMLVTRGTDGEEPLTIDELVGFCILLLIAGNETTTNLLGNWTRTLLARPDVEAALRDDPSRIAASFEEQLRYDGPVQCLFRGTTAPTEIGGESLDAGTRLVVLFASANRDEEKWGPDADTFRLDRQPPDHVGFGHGIHLCLGAPLARLEARVAAEVLFERTSAFEASGDIVGTASFLLRGCTSIPLTVKPA